MAAYSKQILSGSTDGAPIAVATTATAVHTIPSGTATKDEIYIYATNVSDSAAVLTLNFAGADIINTIDGKAGLYLILPGMILQNAKAITATASADSSIKVLGWVNRITE